MSWTANFDKSSCFNVEKSTLSPPQGGLRKKMALTYRKSLVEVKRPGRGWHPQRGHAGCGAHHRGGECGASGHRREGRRLSHPVQPNLTRGGGKGRRKHCTCIDSQPQCKHRRFLSGVLQSRMTLLRSRSQQVRSLCVMPRAKSEAVKTFSMRCRKNAALAIAAGQASGGQAAHLEVRWSGPCWK